jgi:hypothetical protein
MTADASFADSLGWTPSLGALIALLDVAGDLLAANWYRISGTDVSGAPVPRRPTPESADYM